MKIEITVEGNLLTQGEGWIAYDRVNIVKDTLVLYNIRNIVKSYYFLSFEELLGEIRKYLKTKKERSNVDLYVNEDSVEICKLNKIIPTIWITKI